MNDKSEHMKWVIGGLLVICSSMIVLTLVLLMAGAAHASEPFRGKVVGVADGDTLTVLTDTTQVKVRLAERLARESGLGLWVDAAPTAPWLFRKAKRK